MIGEWNCRLYEGPIGENRFVAGGTWIFQRVLDGNAVQDVFQFTSKTGSDEYSRQGTNLRVFNRDTMNYDVSHVCNGRVTRLTYTKAEDGKLIGTSEGSDIIWTFTDVTNSFFHWEMREKKNGEEKIILSIEGVPKKR